MMTRLLRHRTATLGLAILSLMLLLAAAGPLVAPSDYFATDLEGALRGPTTEHPFGQDKLGRDVFWQVVIGARTSILVALAVVLTTAVVGCLLGAAAGYFGGIVDLLVMRTVDILLAFPGILLAVALAGVLGPSLWNVILVLSILGWVGYARLVRAQFLSLRGLEHAVVLDGNRIDATTIQFLAQVGGLVGIVHQYRDIARQNGLVVE